MIAIGHQEQLTKKFMMLTEDVLMKKALGSSAEAKFKASDKALNDQYKTTLKSYQSYFEPSDDSKEEKASAQENNKLLLGDLQSAQKAWIVYRDAWIAFVMSFYPESELALKTLLNNQRTEELVGQEP